MTDSAITNEPIKITDIDVLADQLCSAVKGDFDFTVSSSSDNESIQKLSMLINFVLDAARRSLADINEKNIKLAELDKLKSDFLANMSHELRTPLTLIMGPLETILNNDGSSLTAKHQEELHRMQRNAMRLYIMVNQLLDFSKIEAGKYELHEEFFDLNYLLAQIADDAQGLIANNQLSLQFFPLNDNGFFWYDKKVIEKIVLNLLINAIKFTPSGGKIEMHLEKDNENIIIRVKDTGVGISEEQLSHLFERFQQADSSSTRKHEGTGLGLALIDEFVQLMNGEIGVISRENEGTVFTITLPITETKNIAEREKKSAGADDVAAIQPIKVSLSKLAFKDISKTLAEQKPLGNLPLIILADDNPDLRAYIISLLENFYEIVVVDNGKSALEAVYLYQPQLVISDVMMPIMDGYQLTKAIKSDDTIKNIPVILLTAKAGKESLTSGFEVGADDYLSKPFSHEELIARTRSAINGYQNYLSLLAEITERKKLEKENAEKAALLSHAGRLAALGEMATGIAHELNQPLSIIRTNMQSLSFLKNENLPLTDMDEIIASSIRQVDRASNIITHMRSFARKEENEFSMMDISIPIDAAVNMFNEQFRLHDIEIEREYDTELPEIYIEAQKVEQLVVNLLSNARYAVEENRKEKGSNFKMKIRLKLKYIQENKKILFEVIDNGLGMSPEVVEHCMEAFFTTKKVGEGTGLGLIIVYNIVKLFKGDIEIKSTVGVGTSITIMLPVE